jgi:hypothetical protein
MERDENELFKIGPPKKEKIPGNILPAIDQRLSIKKYFLFMEGKTEYNYLNGFKEIYLENNKKIELKLIEPKDTSNNARLLLDEASKYILSEKEKINENLDNDFNLISITNDDEIRIIFDCDENFDQKGKDELTHAEYAKKIAEKNKFTIIFSNYNIEVWILCHFKKPTKSCKGTNLIKQIKSISGWTKYKKNDKQIFSKIKDKLDNAIKNSKSLINEKDIEIFSKESNPVTEMGVLIEEIKDNI